MKYFLLMGLWLWTAQALAAALPANSRWLTHNAYLQAISTGDRIVAVGDRAAIIYSDNQGRTWHRAKQVPNPAYAEQTAQPSRAMLTDVCFAADGKHGWAVGHDATVMATTDGGETWMVQYNDPLNATNPVGHTTEPASTADSGTEKTTDSSSGGWDNSGGGWSNSGGGWGDSGGGWGSSGGGWGDSGGGWDNAGGSMLPAVDPTGAPLLGVWCDPANADHVIAVGGFGYFLETTNGGAKWEQDTSRLDNPDGWNLYDIEGVPNGHGAVFVVGERGTVFLSLDSGATWKKVNSPYEGTFFGVLATGPGSVLAYGLQGNIWLTHSYGQGWKKIPSHTSSGINNGVVARNGDLLLVGNNGVLLQSGESQFQFNKRLVEQHAALSSVLPLANGSLVVTGVNGIHLIAGK